MPDVNVEPFEIEGTTRHGDLVRADVYLPNGEQGQVPVVLGASPYQKSLRHLPVHPQFPFNEYGPMQLYLDHGYGYVAMDVPGTGRSEGTWDPVSREEGEAIHDMIEHVATQDWCDGEIGMIGMSYYCWSQWNAARTRPPHLKTIVAYDGATDMYRDWMYQGGIPIQGFLNAWLFGSTLLQHQAQGSTFTSARRIRSSTTCSTIASTMNGSDAFRHSGSSPTSTSRVLDGGRGERPRCTARPLRRLPARLGTEQLLVAHPNSFAAALMYFYDRSPPPRLLP